MQGIELTENILVLLKNPVFSYNKTRQDKTYISATIIRKLMLLGSPDGQIVFLPQGPYESNSVDF